MYHVALFSCETLRLKFSVITWRGGGHVLPERLSPTLATLTVKVDDVGDSVRVASLVKSKRLKVDGVYFQKVNARKMTGFPAGRGHASGEHARSYWFNAYYTASFGSTSSDLIAASIYDKHSVGPSIRPIYTRCYSTMTNMIQVCRNFIKPDCLS